MPSRLTYIFQLTTEVLDASASRAHTGGWSETIWRPEQSTTKASIDQIGVLRASLLPKQADIVGYRQQVFTLDGNTLKPGGANSGALTIPGNAAFDCDHPQSALQINLVSNGVANIGKMTLRGVPDEMIRRGEYAPHRVFALNVQNYLFLLNRLSSQFLGRDLSLPNVRVSSIIAGVLTTTDNTGAAVGDYIRLLRVSDSDGKPVTGTFRVTAVAGLAHTLAGFNPNIAVLNSGRARVDKLQLFPISSGQVKRARVKKIGRPSEGYRGRASKRRAG